MANFEYYASTVRKFQLLGSQCRLLIVYDDLDSSQRIPNATLAEWALELGGERWLVNIASLARRFYGHDRHPFASTTMNSLATKQGHAWTMRTHRKLFLWALPREQFPKVVLIDTDMVLLRNLDYSRCHSPRASPLQSCAAAPQSFSPGSLSFIRPGGRSEASLQSPVS